MATCAFYYYSFPIYEDTLASGRGSVAFHRPGKEGLAKVSDTLVTPKAPILERLAHCGQDGAKSLSLRFPSPGAPGFHFPRRNGAVGATEVPGGTSYSGLLTRPRPGPAASRAAGQLVLPGPGFWAGAPPLAQPDPPACGSESPARPAATAPRVAPSSRGRSPLSGSPGGDQVPPETGAGPRAATTWDWQQDAQR